MILRSKNSKEMWPNFFIVGAPRSGTTSLYEYLRQVPGIYMSPVKEPYYFSTGIRIGPFARKPIRSKVQYLKLFRGVRDERAVGEASTAYLRHPETPRRIKDAVQDARIIMILRDPVERAYSQYLRLHVREGWRGPPLQEAMQTDYYLDPGFYAEPVKRYLDTFGAERVKILIFEEYIRDTRQAVREVLAFLGVNGEPPATVGEVHNAFATPRGAWARLVLGSVWVRRTARTLIPGPLRRMVKHKILLEESSKLTLSQETRDVLEDVYRADVQRLEEILARPLPWFHRREQPS